MQWTLDPVASEISKKADIVSNAVNGNFAGLDANGNLTDSGFESTDFISASNKGAANGVAELDNNGKIPTSQLPSYVDDVLEYANTGSFPLTGESGKIYVAIDTNKTYRWSGSGYVEISESLALGETSSTAYRGDRGKTAYDHASAKGSAFSSGLYKITTNSEGHVTAATAVSKSDITGLGIPGSDTTYGVATANANGLMSSTDKSKLDGIAAGATANVGTITGINMNGASKGTSGVVDLGTVLTSHQDISGKLNRTGDVFTGQLWGPEFVGNGTPCFIWAHYNGEIRARINGVADGGSMDFWANGGANAHRMYLGCNTTSAYIDMYNSAYHRAHFSMESDYLTISEWDDAGNSRIFAFSRSDGLLALNDVYSWNCSQTLSSLNNNKVDKYSTAGLSAIELSPPSSAAGHGGFIDFHYNASSADFTSRIIEASQGNIEINGISITGLNNSLANKIDKVGNTYDRCILAGYVTGSGNYIDFFVPASTSNENYYGATFGTDSKAFIVDATPINIGGRVATKQYRTAGGYIFEISTGTPLTPNRPCSVLATTLTFG